jgi:hypothetical protein
MTRPGALESKKTLWGRLPQPTDESVFEKMRTHLPDGPKIQIPKEKPLLMNLLGDLSLYLVLTF